VGANYDRVVWIDSDIIINSQSPSILDGVPPEKIGATDESDYPSREIRLAINADAAFVAQTTDAAMAEFIRRCAVPALWHADGGTPYDASIDAIVRRPCPDTVPAS
jgi:hypothetical protein